jgi:hypothetical protein
LLGGRFDFDSNSTQLLQLLKVAYEGLPRHRLSARPAPFHVGLRLVDRAAAPAVREPPIVRMHSGAGLLCGYMDAANFVVLSPHQRSGLVVVSRDMLRFAYHVRYELIEFAVFTLASRSQGLVPLHAACVGREGRGLLLMGSSGAGKSTMALHCLMQGLDVIAEDAVFVGSGKLLATGVANFLHVRRDALAFVDDSVAASRIRGSPVIHRRSGAEKFEVDLRRLPWRAAPAPLEIVGVVFLSAKRAGRGAVMTPLPHRRWHARLDAMQPYAAAQPVWQDFRERIRALRAFELRRPPHPREAVMALRRLLD